ncbi:MAG: flagellar assembly protein FliH, partial [Spirochaetia bacterium]|nr:flagellar assembly protein FliH [Spirochaetia bacterium]
EGFAKGEKEGFEKGLDQVNKLISQLELITRDVDECKRNILENAKHDIVDLAVEIAEKVVKATCSKQRDVAFRNAEYALGLLKEKSPVVIRVNLADMEVLREYRSLLLNMFDKVESIKIAEDHSVEQGGCVVESTTGGVDARISTQLSSIRSSLHEE